MFVRVGILMAFSRSIFSFIVRVLWCSLVLFFWSSAKSSPSVLHTTWSTSEAKQKKIMAVLTTVESAAGAMSARPLAKMATESYLNESRADALGSTYGPHLSKNLRT